jgi:ribonuclease HII
VPRDGARWSTIERTLRSARGPLLAGVDEVGRGPLAGPVVACAVVMHCEARAIRGVDDSKQLSSAEREKLAARINERALALAIGAASVREIDRLNIYHASVLAIRRAITRLAVRPDHVLIDGLTIRTLGIEHTAIVSGDARCHSVACASIVAKVTRDRLMRALARRHPQYHWETNVGYGTPEHHAGIASYGITPHHRRSFGPVSQLSLALTVAPPEEAAALADALLDILDQEPVS